MPEKFPFGMLSQFTGTETWYRHPLVKGILYTDGAKFVAEKGEAYWLLDEIALAQISNKTVKNEEFQVWKLSVTDGRGVLSCENGYGKMVFSKKIEFTDFPEPGVELWFENKVIYLPSER